MVDEGLAEGGRRSIMVQMVGFHIRNDGNGGVVLAETAVRLVRLRHKHVTLPDMSAVDGPLCRLDGAPDGVAWIGEPTCSGLSQDMGGQGAGCGLTVSTCDGHGTPRGHQEGEDVAAMQDPGALSTGRQNLRVIRLDGTGPDHGQGTQHILGLLTYVNRNAQLLQTLGLLAGLPVGTRNLDTGLMEHLGQNTHTGSPDTDEVGRTQGPRVGDSRSGQ